MRLKLPVPEKKPLFSTPYTLGLQDMNYGNHLGNDKVLTLAHEARLRFFKNLGYDELNFFGSALIQANSQIQYCAQGFFGDQLLINLWIIEKNAYGFDLFTHIKREETELARVHTSLVFFDYEKNKIAKCPTKFLDYVEAM